LENLKKVIPDAHVKQTFMPTFEVFNSGLIAKQDARRQLSIDGNTIMFFGFVRPYKGLNYLIDAMPKIIKHVNVNLLIVGEFWEGQEKYRDQIKKLGLGRNIKIIDEYVPNEKVGLYFAACDLVVLPYTSATGSAIVQAAFSCNTPVISTNVGCFPEVIDHNGTGYLVPAEDSQALAGAVVAFYKEGKEKEFVNNIIKRKEEFSWGRMVEMVESFQ
jgi:glycosyltransferase involved in cell wall biosynthesis